MRITIVVGNPKPQSRTRRIAEMLIESLFPDNQIDLQVIELCDHTDEIFKWPSPQMATLTQHVADSQLVVFASPTYKASYTGLLKVFLDRYPANGLHGVTAIAVMTGADFSHSLTPTFTLNSLLFELGATVPIRGLYFNTAQFDQVNKLVSDAAEVVRNGFKSTKAIADLIAGSTKSQ